MQEIRACGRKKDGMLYFPCPITTLCTKQGVKERYTDEISNPKAGFDRNALQLLMKPKTSKKMEEGQKSTQEVDNSENSSRMWKLLTQIQKDQRDYFKFQKKKHEWGAKVYRMLGGDEIAPPFPDHILGKGG